MAYAEILLMRHGAGIKPGQDREKVPPSPAGVLTAAGHREAEAVGHTLAETVMSSYPFVRSVAVLYPCPPAGREYPCPPAGREYPCPPAGPEPKATATVVAQQLQAAGLSIDGPNPWEICLPGAILVTSDVRNIKDVRKGFQRDINSAAEKLEGKCSKGRLILVVANSPQVDWLAERLLKKPVAIGRGEVIGIGNPCRRRQWRTRRCRDLLWTIGPSEESEIKDLRDKIRSKMDTAKFLGAFITALVTFVLGKRFDSVKDAGFQAGLPWVQTILWLITIVGLGLAALLCFAAVVCYDSLLMPVRFWESSVRPSLFRRRRPSVVRWLVWRPPSSAARVLQQNMIRVWNRLVVLAMVILGVALAAFAVLVVVKPTRYVDLIVPVAVVIAISTATFGYLILARPRLGAQD
jgi:hypothetical protein